MAESAKANLPTKSLYAQRVIDPLSREQVGIQTLSR